MNANDHELVPEADKPARTLVIDGGQKSALVTLAMLAAVGIPATAIDTLLPKPKPLRIFTHADEERIRKAEEKRLRKAAKRRGGAR